jgi:hypothetical protein
VCIARRVVSGGQRVIWLACALVVVATSLAAAGQAGAADQPQPPRTLWKAFPLQQRQQQPRRNNPRLHEPPASRSSAASDKLLVGAAAAVTAIVIAGLSWLIMTPRPRKRGARAVRDHVDPIGYAVFAIVVGIGIGVFAGLYL